MKIDNWFKNLSKAHKILVLVICIILMLDVLLALGLTVGNNHSSVKVSSVNISTPVSLIALNSNAKAGKIKENDYAYYKFSQTQKNWFKQTFEENGTVALTVRVKINPTTKQCLLLDKENPLVFEFGFLGDDDFSKKGKFIKQIYPNSKRIVVQADERYAPDVFDVSISLQKNEAVEKYIPQGFFIKSALRAQIIAAAVVPSQIGFDVSSDIPFYGYAYNGGKIDFKNKSFDFSGASLVFPVQNTATTRMPEFTVKLSSEAQYKSTIDKMKYADFNFGGEKLFIKNVTSATELKIPAAGIRAPFSRMEITNNPEYITSVILEHVPVKNQVKNYVDEPIKTDPGLIQFYKIENWRCDEYELYQWDRFPEILIFDTKDFDIQGRFFTRLAYFVEKEGYRGCLVSDEELEGKHGYNAHDYKTEDLARFFNKAQEERFPLNPYELTLKKILITNGLFEQDGEYVKPLKGEIASISRQSEEWSRTNLIAHELYHMVFFMDEEFRNYTTAVYHTCDQSTLAFLIDYFKSQPSLGYDTTDQNLMYTEFMSYVMEKRTSDVARSFVEKAKWGTVNNFTPELAAYIRNTEGRGFEDISNALTDFVFDKYGIVAGNLALIGRN